MAKSSNQKQKILLLLQLLWERTEGEHYLSVQQMIDILSAQGIAAERKSIYDDIEVLRQMGLDIPADVYTIPYAVKTIQKALAAKQGGRANA